MNVEAPLTAAEKTFLARAVPHFMAGKSIEDSLRTVLADDERLFAALMDRGSSHYVPTPDERGYSHSTGVRVGNVISSELSRTVYNKLRADEVSA